MPFRFFAAAFWRPNLTVFFLVAAGFCCSGVNARALHEPAPTLVQEHFRAPGENGPSALPDPLITGPSNHSPVDDAMRHDPDEPPPPVLYDPELLPEPVRRMRRLIIEACRSGDLENLRPLLGFGSDATLVMIDERPEDPIAFLRESSGDEEGHEILAILLEVMEAGFVHLNPGTDQELFVWPYFFAIPLDDLTPQQKVELFTLLTATDYKEMESFGAYVFYRAAITPEGRWLYFVAGD